MTSTAELMRKVRGIRILANRLVDDRLAGDWHSSFHGQGLEFDEIREYAPGDDVRDIDWNATARTGAPRVKRWSEERQLTVMLLVDVSASQGFGSGGRPKSDVAAELACLLALASVRNQDNVGLILFSDRIVKTLPPRKGRHAVMRIVREVLAAAQDDVGGGTDIRGALEYLSAIRGRRAVVFLVSDFIAKDWEKPLAAVARRHDLICCPLSDPAERELPDAGALELEDPETGETVWADLSSRAVREGFAKAAAERSAALLETFRRDGAGCIAVDTASDPAGPVRAFFRRRAARAR
ncbi:MAG: DUF58 domain-containing protein, partial [Kiritimatiellae bacterium]|nr:DUF58 domain-containing protein [Kiritimatiellia bacterium]